MIIIGCAATRKAGRMTAKNEDQVKLILDKVSELVPNFSLENTPAEYGAEVYRIIKEITGVADPYKQIKEDSIKEALAMYSDLKLIIEITH